MPSLAALRVRPAPRVRGRVRPPGDKSISDRYDMLAALADGESELAGYAPGADCASTLRCLEALGVPIRRLPDEPGTVCLIGRGLHALRSPAAPLDTGNSGTTMRLMAGVLAGQPFAATLTGDDSLRRR